MRVWYTITVGSFPAHTTSARGKFAFQGARIVSLEGQGSPSSVREKNTPKLSFSRAYSLSLSPQLIYTRSSLLPALVASKAYQQLEFLAVGSWWVYESSEILEGEIDKPTTGLTKGRIKKIPGGKEDVFADKTIDLKSKRSLMNFLRLAANVEAHEPITHEWGDRSFGDFLTTQYGLILPLQSALHALTLSPHSLNRTKMSYALPRICRHLTSIGVFGPGFGSVIPKWGGIAEIAQVACRAGAVGGGVYVLNKGVRDIRNLQDGDQENVEDANGGGGKTLFLQLQDGEEIRTSWVAGCYDDIPSSMSDSAELDLPYTSRMISIVSSPLSSLFPVIAEGSPPPAGAVVVFPTGTINLHSYSPSTELPPIYLMIHSSETGECPIDQSKCSRVSTR